MTRLGLLAATILGAAALGSNAALAQPYPGPPGPPPHHQGYPPPPPPFHHGYGPPPPYHPGYGPPPYHPGYGPPPGAWRGWHPGDRFYGERYVIHDYDYGRYRLRPPPYGYEWVQDRGQFVLIGINTGIVANIFIP